MEINTKEKRKFTYLMRNTDTKTAIYFEEKTEKFYNYKQETISENWGFANMFLALLSIFLKNSFVNSIFLAYFLSCLFGIFLEYLV